MISLSLKGLWATFQRIKPERFYTNIHTNRERTLFIPSNSCAWTTSCSRPVPKIYLSAPGVPGCLSIHPNSRVTTDIVQGVYLWKPILSMLWMILQALVSGHSNGLSNNWFQLIEKRIDVMMRFQLKSGIYSSWTVNGVYGTLAQRQCSNHSCRIPRKTSVIENFVQMKNN